MDLQSCFELKCKRSVEYRCMCQNPEIYLCKQHLRNHSKQPGTHVFESIFCDLSNGTKEAILNFIAKEKTKRDKWKCKIIGSFTKKIGRFEEVIKELLRRIDSESETIHSLYQKILIVNKISRFEQDPVLKLLVLPPEEAIVKIKSIVPKSHYSSLSLKSLCWLSDEFEKIFESLFRARLEEFLESKLSNTISLSSKNYDSQLNNSGVYNQLANITKSISDLMNVMKKNKSELEDWQKKIEEKLEIQSISIGSQQNDTFISTINETQSCQDNPENYTDENYWNAKLDKPLKNQPNSIKTLQKSAEVSFSNTPINAWVNELKEKITVLSNGEINPEIQREFRHTCWIYEHERREPLNLNTMLEKAYLDYTKTYHQATSLYLIDWDYNRNANLIIYDTENETKTVKKLETQKELNSGTCLTKIPGGNLFCYGKRHKSSGVTMIIDMEYKLRILPEGRPCYCSSAIYLNRSVYCFGGWYDNDNLLNLSERFDLDKNRWFKLTSLPLADAHCHCIVFKGNILISGYQNQNLLRYSIEENDFTPIPYNFSERKTKILINEVRLYLIECGGFIYESDVGDEYRWRSIKKSIITDNWPSQIYLSCNKEAIYIGSIYPSGYYKFNLDEKLMIQL